MNARARGDMIAQIIELGYTPTSKSTLWRLMQKRDAGKKVDDSLWAVTRQNKAKSKENGMYVPLPLDASPHLRLRSIRRTGYKKRNVTRPQVFRGPKTIEHFARSFRSRMA